VKVVSVQDAVQAIPDGATVAADGFTMMGVAEAIYEGIEGAFRTRGHPRDLVIVHGAGQSNRVRGFEHFAVDGLARRVVGPHWGLMPRMSAFLGEGRAEAVCLPQGQISTLYRAIAARRPGNLSRIGLGTFVDPRVEGGKVNAPARERAPDYVELLRLGDEEVLLYRAFPIEVGIIRMTTVDEDGNGSQEEEAVTLDALAIAQAAHNHGGLVICQAKQLVPRGSIPPKQVAAPACLIDLVVLAPDPQTQQRQTDRTAFDPRYVSAAPGGRVELARAQFSPRLAIGRRAVRFLREGDVVNLGTGIPGDTVGPALAEAGLAGRVTLTVESGVYGGVPEGGVDFGISAHPSAIIPHPAQFDFYNGGGLDATFMGTGQVDREGNVNVSKLGGRIIGAGGFIDITQSARMVCFCFLFQSKHPKFVERVDHLTFSAAQALRNRQRVYYVTDRAVFELRTGGLTLLEVAPGMEAKRDVLDHLPFPVQLADPLGTMPADIFQPEVRPFNLQRRKAGFRFIGAGASGEPGSDTGRRAGEIDYEPPSWR